MTAFCMDFLCFSVAYEDMGAFFSTLPVQPVLLEYGFSGYTNSALIGSAGGRVAWSPERPEQKVFFSLPSRALRELAGLSSDWADSSWVLHWLISAGAKVGRIDVAWDDRAGVLPSPGVIRDWAYQGNVSSRWKSVRRSDNFKLHSNHDKGDEGETVYFGSSESDAMLRIYDKAAERRAAGETVEGSWVRVELQMRHDRAHLMACEVAKVWRDGARAVSRLVGVLRGYIDFKAPNPGDSNVRRWATVSWWVAFLEDATKARLVTEKVVKTLDTVRSWVERSVSASLATIEKGMGFDGAWAWLYEVVNDGKKRMGARHQAILSASVAMVGA